MGANAFQAVQQQKARGRFLRQPHECQFCRASLAYEKRRDHFCNRSCAASFHNARRSPKYRCHDCGTAVPSKRKFCGPCKTKLENVRSDGSRKRILIKETGHRCWICRQTEWMGQPIPLELDHIDGNSDNNTRGNLRLGCPNCHAQTPTYKARNKGRAGSRGQTRTKLVASSKVGQLAFQAGE